MNFAYRFVYVSLCVEITSDVQNYIIYSPIYIKVTFLALGHWLIQAQWSNLELKVKSASTRVPLDWRHNRRDVVSNH